MNLSKEDFKKLSKFDIPITEEELQIQVRPIKSVIENFRMCGKY